MREKKEKIQMQVGAFVAVGGFLFMLVLFLLGAEKKFFERQYTLTATFGSISGLRTGAPVQLAGIKVGAVNQILFDEKIEQKKVRVLLRINQSYQERIRRDSVATIMTQGLLGDKIVFISVGSPTEAVLGDGNEISAKVTTDMTKVFEKGEDLLDEIILAAENVNGILVHVRKGKGVLHELVYDEEGQHLVQDMRSITLSLDDAGQNISSITHKVNEGQGTLGALVNDASIYNDMKTLLGKANRNKLIRAVVRAMLQAKEEKSLKKE